MASLNTDLTRRLRDLVDAAGELTAAEDEDALLHTVIRKARQLIGTDLAYLMLLDREAGDTYMRVTDGAISPLFDTIRLGMGLGLGGQVAESMSPRWTRDYLEDEQYTHVIDPIVLDEGLRAILGVPVKKHGKLTGILFTSERSERDFTQDDVTVLALLADHASIAIDAVVRGDDLRTELESTRSELHTQLLQSQQMREAMALHDQLTALVVAGAPVSSIIDLLVNVAGGTAAVFDDTLREIGSTCAAGAPEPRVLREAAETVSIDLTETATMLRAPSVVVTPIMTGSDRLGTLTLTGHRATADLRQILERVASVIALILLGQRAHDEADNRVRGELLAEILARGDTDLDSLRRRAALIDVDLDAELLAFVLLPAQLPVTRLLQAECSALARREGGLVTSYGDRVVMLLPGTEPGPTARVVASKLAPLGVTVGASGPMRHLADVDDHVERSRRAARLLVALDRAGEGAATEELGVYGLLFSDVDRDYVAKFVETTVGPVLDYDRSRGTELLDTLRAWFDAEGSASGTAERLYVHINTVYQRLERLDHVLGQGWRSGDRVLEVRLALRLSELMTT